MKKLILTAFLGLALLSCKEEEVVDLHPVTFTFSQSVDGQALVTNDIIYSNESGNEFSVETLQYLISDIELIKSDGQSFLINGYRLVDINDNLTFEFDPEVQMEEGEYNGIRFTFGFDPAKNFTGDYPDLNVKNWNWPEMLGGGYHFMKLEGKFIDVDQNTVGFATHMGTARFIDGDDTFFFENHVDVVLQQKFTITSDTDITINMEILNWYKNPNTWDLNELGSGIMPNYDAQVMLRQNGSDVFSLGEITSQ